MTTIQTKYCKILEVFTKFYSVRWVHTVGNGCKILIREPVITPVWEIIEGTQKYFDTNREIQITRYLIVRDSANTRLYTPGRSSSHYELHKWWNQLSHHEKIQIVINL